MKKKNVLKKVDVYGFHVETQTTRLVSGNVTLLDAYEICSDWYNMEKYSQMYIVYHTPEEIFTSKKQII